MASDGGDGRAVRALCATSMPPHSVDDNLLLVRFPRNAAGTLTSETFSLVSIIIWYQCALQMKRLKISSDGVTGRTEAEVLRISAAITLDNTSNHFGQLYFIFCLMRNEESAKAISPSFNSGRA